MYKATEKKNFILFAMKSVLDRPNISDGTCTLQGHSVNLRCDVFLYQDSPALTDVFWTKDGIKLDIATHNGKYAVSDTTYPSLTINNVNYNDAGDYQLTVVNAVGKSSSEVIVLGNKIYLSNCTPKITKRHHFSLKSPRTYNTKLLS